jgi:sugar/nucleoside kinase (ribokinase family)
MSLLVVGSVAYDTVETHVGRRDDMLGGSATYFGLASSLFVAPSLVAVVGQDFKENDIAILGNHGIRLEGLERAEGKTFRWGGRYHDNMKERDTLFTELNVFEAFKPQLTTEQRNASVVFLANIHPGLQLSVLDQVECPRFVAADTMNFWISGARELLLKVISRIDALFINDEEAAELTGCRTMIGAAKAIQDMGPEIVVIKRGEHGALMLNHDDLFYTPAYPLEHVIDPTGAGDTFAGAFMGHLTSTQDFTPQNMRRSAVVGTMVASFCVEGFGIENLRVLDIDAVSHRYTAFSSLLTFPPIGL